MTRATNSVVRVLARRLPAVAGLIFCALSPAWAELRPDQLVLIVNRAEPAGDDLARFYAQARGVPLDHILALDLPKTEEMPFDRYERDVVPVVRKFLRERGLDQSTRCLVTFYGVPLRISNRENGPGEIIELRELRDIMSRITAHVTGLVADLEAKAREVLPDFKPVNEDTSLDALIRRATAAGQVIEQALPRTFDIQARVKLGEFIREMTIRLAAPLDPNQPPPAPSTAPSTAPATDLLDRAYDPAARKTLRELARTGPVIAYARLIQGQIEYLLTDATGSAVDNELPVLFWPAHSRVRWQDNPLNAKFVGLHVPPTLMVMRLDAPTPQMVKDMIANGMATEREGLKGQFAIDARGLAPRVANGDADPFGIFDQRFRDLAAFVKEKTTVPVVLDDSPEVFHSTPIIDDVALYAGWYSLSNYIPAFRFNRGAVGYHVASFELMNLHGPLTGQWVRNLLENGCVGTLGPVAEPYLHSFPLPDEFFPLLLTGKLNLAEVYWATTPLVSWMQTAIGDPLYNPFAKNPMLKVEDLSPQLQKVLPAAP